MAIETTRRLQADVVVAGGGMAGVCAAIAAARGGAQTVLIQDRPVLGGNASSEVRMTIGGAAFSGRRANARETGILEQMRLEDAVRNPQHGAQLWDLLLWEWVRREPRLTLLLNTSVDGVEMAGSRRIALAHAGRPSTEERFEIEAGLYLDCTGDGRLGAEAGADYVVGREAQATYGERSAPAAADRRVLGSSVLFQARDYGRPTPFKAPAYARRFTEADLAFREHTPFSYGFWWMEYGGELDTIKDAEAIRDELYAIAMGVWDHIKNGGEHGAENWGLEWIGMLPGKRESRRFLGPHVLTQSDLEDAVLFEDRVAYGGWPIDTHPPAGIYDAGEPCHQPMLSAMYSIPLRALYSRNVDNLFMAGRNISASHLAFASLRVMATCAVMGQAAGTAAALCRRLGKMPGQLSRGEVAGLQQQLLKDDCFLLGLPNRDPADLALGATAVASSEAAGCAAGNVVNGVTRTTEEGTNMWMSAPGEALPQWVELRFERPARLREVRLTFDTALSRILAITYYPQLYPLMVRGAQPETVRDYRLLARVGDEWREVGRGQGNYQRLCVHGLDGTLAEALRLVVEGTNGAAEARVFEMRAYGE